MDKLSNISHIYRGLILRNRAFASFKNDEVDKIYSDLKSTIKIGDCIFDPMSGYGGVMRYFGKLGYKTHNLEINPPAYFWQLLVNPGNKTIVLHNIQKIILEKRKFPKIRTNFSLANEYYSKDAIDHIKNLLQLILFDKSKREKELSIALLLPFVSRFANYVKNSTNITHFKMGGYCSFDGWENDFIDYLICIKDMLISDVYLEKHHKNILGNILTYDSEDRKYNYFITSPPYPNYRDYSKIFILENYILNTVLNYNTNFENMIGSNNVSGKISGRIYSQNAKKFLTTLLEKSVFLNKKSQRDIEVYYQPYFRLYFFQIQEAFEKLTKMLAKHSTGYIVVNDNITRDIIVPVGAVICDIFKILGYSANSHDIAMISHYGNIGSSAKRINSHHSRHIIKICKK